MKEQKDYQNKLAFFQVKVYYKRSRANPIFTRAGLLILFIFMLGWRASLITFTSLCLLVCLLAMFFGGANYI